MGERNIYGIIYTIKNKINNKLYIGQTIKEKGFIDRYPCGNTDMERVYNYHLYRKENNSSYNDHLLKSINKYGLDEWEIDKEFDIAYSKEELDKLEKLYIAIYSTMNPKYGYNKTDGGANGRPNNEIRKKISDAKMGENHPYYGKTFSIEHRKNMGNNRKGDKNPMYGKRKNLESNCEEKIKNRIFSEDHKKNLKENHPNFERGNHPSAKKIVCITTKIVFGCIKNGAEYCNISYCGLKGHLKKNKITLSYGETVDGLELTWDYYTHYVEENGEEGLIYEEDLRTIK